MERRIIPSGRLRRVAPLIGLTGRVAGESARNSIARRLPFVRDPSAEEFHARAAARYAEQLGRSKGVLMKAGQMLSFTAVDTIIGPEHAATWQNALARLQDDAPPMPAEIAFGVVEAEFASAPEELFAWIDPKPLAAASIGQVHAARTRDDRDVVVKIQYPGVAEAIADDLRNTELLGVFLQLISGFAPQIQGADTRVIAREIADRIGEEVDYWTEAANQTVFADAYRGHPFIHVPHVIPGLCGERVLTMERARGRTIAETAGAPQELRDAWGEAVMRFYLGSMRRLRIFHADPHPGNFLFHDNGSVTFLDFGCVRRYSRTQVQRVAAMLDATVEGDPDVLMEALVDIGIFQPDNLPDPIAALDWQRAWLPDYRHGLTYAHSPETAAQIARAMFSPRLHRGVVAKAGIGPSYVMLTRIVLGINMILGTLRASGPWDAIRREWDHNDPPATVLGEADQQFWATRTHNRTGESK